MNPGQKMFYDFILERAKDDKKEEAKTLMEENFARQEEGTFDRDYLKSIMPKYLELVKPDAVEDVKEAMNSFASRL